MYRHLSQFHNCLFQLKTKVYFYYNIYYFFKVDIVDWNRREASVSRAESPEGPFERDKS